MSANYGKFDPLQVEKVWALALGGHTGAKIARMLKVGFPRDDPPIAPLKVTPQAVNDLIRKCRAEWHELENIRIATVPTEANADALRARILRIANREAERLALNQSVGKLDPDQLRKLARAAKGIEEMEQTAQARKAKRSPRPEPGHKAPADPPPQSFVDGLLRKGTEDGGEAAPGGSPSGIAPPEVP